jgi:hypothetical protein
VTGAIKGDTAAAIEFLKRWAPNGRWALSAIDPEKPGVIETRTFDIEAENYCAAWIERYQGKRNLYFAPNPLRRAVTKKAKKEDVAALAVLHSDLDDKDFGGSRKAVWETLKRLPAHLQQPSVIIESGGGLQTFWRLATAALVNGSVDPLEAYSKAIAEVLGGDNCWNIDRVMRLPGTINVPNAVKKAAGRTPVLAKLHTFDDRTFELAQFDEIVAEAAQRSGENGSAPTDETPNESTSTDGQPLVDVDALRVSPRIKDLIRGVDDQEHVYKSRSDRVFAVAVAMVGAGYDDRTIAAVILDPALKISAHVREQGNPTAYAQKQAANARKVVDPAKAAAAAQAPKREVKIVPFRELLEPDLTRRALVKDVLSRDAIALMIGPAGCGKTFLALDIALHVAAGRPWFGKRVEAGRVVYVAAEAGASIRNRVAAWAREHLPENADDGVSFDAVVSPVDLCHAEAGDVDALAAAIGEADLVIIDTVSRALAGGNENGPDDMGAFVAAMDALRAKLGCAILAVHHIGKDATRGGRGHSLLHCAVDTEIEVDKRDDFVSVATLTKQRDGPTGVEIAFRMRQVDLGEDEYGEAVTSCVVEASEFVPAPKKKDEKGEPKRGSAAKLAQDALEQMIEEGKGETFEVDRATVYAVQVEAWQERMYTLAGDAAWENDNARRQAWDRAKKWLFDKEIVKQRWWAGKDGKKVQWAWFAGASM